MYHCKFCRMTFSSFSQHLEHHQYHINVTAYYHCSFHGCQTFFKTAVHLKIHLRRQHCVALSKRTVQTDAAQIMNDRGKFVCSVPICLSEFDNYHEFIEHLKNHQNVSCPYQNCSKIYRVLSSFTCHL